MKMKKSFLVMATVLGWASTRPAHAQAIVSAPILETENFIQTGLQAGLKALNAKANVLADAGVVEQVLTKVASAKNLALAKEWYDGLLQVSNAVKNYRRVQHIFERQTAIISLYSDYIQRFRQDPHLTPAQVTAMVKGYTTLIGESTNYLDDLTAIVSPLKGKMTDAERMELIDALDDKVTHQYELVSYFTRRNIALSLRESSTTRELDTLKKLYGLR